MGDFAFPETLEGEPFFEPTGDHYEGPIPRVAPAGAVPAPAGAKVSFYRLHRVSDNLQMVEISGWGPPGNFAYDPPPGHVPQGLVQWFVKHPGDTGFTLFGPVFQYRTEKHPQFWERNGL